VAKLIFDLCVAVMAIGEMIPCTASSLSWQFVSNNDDHDDRDVI
jgi:hypothetical protein